jgi:hypothetical protein
MGAQPAFDNQVLIALIAAVAGIITTWLTVKYRNKVVRGHGPNKPKDRMDTIFDGYEKLIMQQQVEIDRKQSVIGNLESIVDNLDRELQTTRDLLSATKDEVAITKRQNIELKDHLQRMRKEYEPHRLEKN